MTCSCVYACVCVVVFVCVRVDAVERTQTDCGAQDLSDSAVVMTTTDAEPTSLPHDLHVSFKDFIIGYPTQTGSSHALLTAFCGQ